MKTLNEQWEHYLKACYGDKSIHDTQLKETKQAFFAGNLIMMEQLTELADVDVNAADARINAMRKEILDVLKPT